MRGFLLSIAAKDIVLLIAGAFLSVVVSVFFGDRIVAIKEWVWSPSASFVDLAQGAEVSRETDVKIQVERWGQNAVWVIIRTPGGQLFVRSGYPDSTGEVLFSGEKPLVIGAEEQRGETFDLYLARAKTAADAVELLNAELVRNADGEPVGVPSSSRLFGLADGSSKTTVVRSD